jgi:hypothetical protein
MSNKGIELQLNFDIIKAQNFNWDLQINLTRLKNRITKLPAETPTINQGTKRLEVGYDIYAFYLVKWYGVDPLDGASLYYAKPGVTTGTRTGPKGEILVTNASNAEFGYAGSAIPKFFGSFTNTVSVKNFSLSFLVNYQVGGKFYDGNYAGLMGVSYGRALHIDALRAWQKPGDVTDIPRLDVSQTGLLNAASDRWLIDASYLNLRNLNLSYSLPKSMVGKLGLDKARVYVGAENLYIFSKRKGMNPAESFNGTNSPVYVPNRLINMGINFTF